MAFEKDLLHADRTEPKKAGTLPRDTIGMKHCWAPRTAAELHTQLRSEIGGRKKTRGAAFQLYLRLLIPTKEVIRSPAASSGMPNRFKSLCVDSGDSAPFKRSRDVGPYLKYVRLRSPIEGRKVLNTVEGQDEPPGGRP